MIQRELLCIHPAHPIYPVILLKAGTHVSDDPEFWIYFLGFLKRNCNEK